MDNSGLYNVDKNANTYKTNANYENYSLRGNVDINVTKKFVISLDIASLMAKWNYPGAYSNSTSRILNALTQTPPNAHPDLQRGRIAQRHLPSTSTTLTDCSTTADIRSSRPAPTTPR